MGLRDMYAYTMKMAKDKFHGTIDERDGKLYFKGTVATDAEKNEIWNAIKTIPDLAEGHRRRYPRDRWAGHDHRRPA